MRNKVTRILKPPSFGIRFDELEEALTTWREAPPLPEPEKPFDAMIEACSKGIKLKETRKQPFAGESFLLNTALENRESSPDAAKCILRVLTEALSPTSPVPAPFYRQEDKNQISIDYYCYLSGDIPVFGFLAKPQGNGPHPIVIVGHHGFWGLTPFSIAAALFLAKQGYLAFAPEYRGQGGSFGVPEMCGGETDDTLNAINHLAEKEGGDPSNVFLLGEGFGGMTSFIAGARRQARGVILLPSILDLPTFWNALQRSSDRGHTWEIVSLVLFCGGVPDQIPEAYRKRSPLQYLDRFKGRVMFLIGDSDPILPATKISDVIRDLKGYSTDYKLVVFSKGNHTQHLGPQGQQIWETISHFLKTAEPLPPPAAAASSEEPE